MALFPNRRKQEALDSTWELAAELVRRGIEVLIPAGLEGSLTFPELRTFPPERPDLIISLGGDGTMLACVRETKGIAPVLGVNLGDVGYLSASEPGSFPRDLDLILSGEIHIEARAMLYAQAHKEPEMVGLNECAVRHRELGRSCRLQIRINGQELGQVRGDGVLVSTPTGSTAYALACGGPLIDPSVRLLLLCAISPHSLFSRPVVINPASLVEILSMSGEVIYLVDGQEVARLEENVALRIGMANQTAQLAFLEKDAFVTVIRRKMHWGRL